MRLLSVDTQSSLVFTSGGTEACNLMLRGFLGNSPQPGERIVSTPIEHPAVSEVLLSLERIGFELCVSRLNSDGRVDVKSVQDLVNGKTTLINIMAANNETGALQPVVELAVGLRAEGYQGLIVSDFTQALGKSELKVQDFFDSGVDAIAISGHKIGAISGIGALVFKQSEVCRLIDPLLLGGPQEKGFRGGTENLLGSLSFGVAAEELLKRQDEEMAEIRRLKSLLWSNLSKGLDGLKLYGSEECLSNTLLIGFKGCLGGDLVAALDIAGVCVSTGSACASGKQGVSDTVQSIEPDPLAAKEVVRFSLDWSTSETEIEKATEIVVNCVSAMRASKLQTAA
jgi:cysteine desulfurase